MSERSILASFVIATRNRPDLAAACIRACKAQDIAPREILVYDDASDVPLIDTLSPDDAAGVLIERLSRNLGQPAVRSLGYKDARGQYVLSLDDDVLIFDTHAVSRAIAVLEAHPEVAVVALRYYEPPRATATPGTDQGISDRSSFTGAIVVLRRKPALDQGCYPDWIYRQGEERFLAIRLLDAGYRIVEYSPPCAIHLASPIRDRKAMNWYGIRNALLFDWICVPHPYCLPYLAKDIVKLFFYKLRLTRIPLKTAAIGWGLWSVLRMRGLRNPVKRETFRKYLSLPRHGALRVPADWTGESLVSTGVLRSVAELQPYLDTSPFGR